MTKISWCRLAAIVALMCGGLAASPVLAQSVFVNELHYDNAGADTAEAIEIAGPAGTDLTGWSIVLYNGESASRRVYHRRTLAGSIPDQGAGFGTLAFVYPPNTIQNGAPDGLALVAPDGSVVQFLSYEGTFIAADGPAAELTSTDIGVTESGATPLGYSLQLTGTGTQYGHFTWTAARVESFGAVNAGQRFGTTGAEFGACGEPATRVHSIQGAGLTSPYAGTRGVVIEGIIVGAFQDPTNGLQGLFVQEPAQREDGDPSTPEGMFVFTGATPSPDVLALTMGDVVRVQGTVTEFNTGGVVLTELTGLTQLQWCGRGEVAALPLTLPLAVDDTLERYEGMLVALSGPLAVTDVNNLGIFGEVTLAPSALITPTQVAFPGAAAVELQAANNRSRIIIDDASARARQNLEPTRYPAGGLSAFNTLRVGQTMVGTLYGIVDHRFGSYRIQPIDFTTFGFDAATNPRPAVPPAVGGRMKIASFNVLNYFTTLTSAGAVCGPSARLGCRGADDEVEFTRQRAKLIAAITALDPQIAGLLELENNGSVAIADLVAGLNAATAPGRYAYIDTGTVGTDAIKVGLLYQPDRVTPIGAHAVLDASVDPRAITTLNRPSVAQTFAPSDSKERFTVVVNHFKSKGSACSATATSAFADPDTGDGQGNCNLTRLSMAYALRDWLVQDPTGSGDPRVLLLGDFNAYALEDPIRLLTQSGYTNLADAFVGREAYSYVFGGQRGTLDYAFANDAMRRFVTGAAEWHINADEPPALDYNLDWTTSIARSPSQQANYYAPIPARASDHDPLVIGLDFGLESKESRQ